MSCTLQECSVLLCLCKETRAMFLSVHHNCKLTDLFAGKRVGLHLVRRHWRTCRFFYQLAEENAKKKAAKNAKKTKWVHF